MSNPSPRRPRKATAAAATAAATALAAVTALAAATLAVAALPPSPAHAATLFADDFEQPTANIWQTGSGGSWSVTTEDGSRVYRQSSTVGLPYAPYAQAGSGSQPGTTVTARVKPAGALGPSSVLAVTGRVSDPNNLYYVGLHGGQLEIGQQAWGHNVPLAATAFAAAPGTWYTLTLSFLVPGAVSGSVAGPGGPATTVSAADPGGTRPGTQVGFWTTSAAASFDDIRLDDELPPTPTPTGPCPVEITIRKGVSYGTAFTATVTFRNISPAPIAVPWVITWRFTDGQVMQSMFNVTWNLRGTLVTVGSPVWFPVVQPGAVSITFGFTATGAVLTRPPADGTFNGLSCGISLM